MAALDVLLPDGTGLDVFREIKQIDSKLPVIFMTGGGGSGTAIEAMQLGAMDYLLKPLDVDRTRRAGPPRAGDSAIDGRAGRSRSRDVRNRSSRRRDDWSLPGDAGSLQGDRSCGVAEHFGADSRRERHGQRAWLLAPSTNTALVPIIRFWP